MENTLDLLEALEHIDPAGLSYQDWVAVGMGLKEAGYPASAWEDWSRRDGKRYHPGECLRKWESFTGNAEPVTGGTVVKMAMDMGWRPAKAGHTLNWDDMIGADRDTVVVVNQDWIETREVEEPQVWDPVREVVSYLKALFDEGDYVGYVTRSHANEDGRYVPSSKGCFDRTAGQLVQALSRCGGDIGAVLGDCTPEAGAWIRFNPLDGKGVKNENVASFRYALVESDTLPIETQNAIIRELELPVAALVHSGGKSLHAIVRIDANSYEEYRARVDYLYSVCRKNGLDIDRQNRNPSRLSRMPGVTRNGRKQFLADTSIGKASWEEWREWIESVSDDLPDIQNISSVKENRPPLAPELITGVLRRGHKLLLSGASKASKSFALIELAISIAEGRSWLGFPCARGRVLYVNLELDTNSCWNRILDVYDALDWNISNNLDVWNLRGQALPMDRLAPKLIRRSRKQHYDAIIIDPIYKVITGDENAADQMAKFCNQFDKVCTELGCAVIYCHHHSKGSQGSKRSMDRASGSGVFARDPDALLDLIELEIGEDLRKQEINNAVGRACAAALQAAGKLDEAGQDDLCSEKAALAACEAALTPREYQDMLPAVKAARRAAERLIALRIEGTLREFPKFPPVNIWFDYPIHRTDESGVLADINPDGIVPPKRKEKRTVQPKEKKQTRLDSLSIAFDACDLDGTGCVSIAELMTYTGKTKNTIRNWVDEHPDFERGDDGVKRVKRVKNT